MVSLDVVEQEIMELEKRDTTYAVCERLAWLYTVRDHIRTDSAPVAVQATVEPCETDALSGSEFLEAASGVDYAGLMGILDKHMECIRAVCPKEYEAVMGKIRALRS